MDTPIASVLFVCLGNICRSPMAQSVLLKMLQDRGLEGRAAVASRGTAAFNAGKPADSRAMAALEAHGYMPISHRAQQIRDADFLAFSQIIAMDRTNLRTLEGWRPPGFEGRIRLLPDAHGTGVLEVPDPFYGDAGEFSRALGLIERGINRLIAELLPASA
jgi:protein-tyrosine phosphatase